VFKDITFPHSLSFIITLALFGSFEVASKPLMPWFDPVVFNFYRFLLGISVLILILFWQNRFHELFQIPVNAWVMLVCAGFINVFFAMSLLQIAVKYSNAATAATVFCCHPLFVYLLAVFFQHESHEWLKVSGLFTGLIGTVLVMFEKGLRVNHGALYALLAALAFALYTILNRFLSGMVKPLVINIVSFFFGLLFLMIYIVIQGKSLHIPLEFFNSPLRFLTGLYIGIIISGFGYIAFIRTIHIDGAVAASLVFLLKPLVVTFLSMLLLHEQLGWYYPIGLVFILTGTAMVLKDRILEKFSDKAD